MADFVSVGPVSDYPPGSLKGLRLNRREVAIANVEGTLYAFSNECPHNRAYLSHGFVRGCEIVCIHHWAVFDIPTGKVVEGPAYEKLPVYEVRVVDEMVEVALPSVEDPA